MSDVTASKSEQDEIRDPIARNKRMFLNDESPEEFENDVSCMARALGAATAPELGLVETAVRYVWKGRRLNAADACSVAVAIHRVKDDFDDRKARSVPPTTPIVAMARDRTATGLMSTTRGCGYVIDQLTILGEWLTTHASFESSQRRLAIWLGGYRPSDLFCDPVIMAFNRAYLGGLGVQGKVTAPMVACWFEHDLPPGMSTADFERQLVPLVTDVPTVKEGHAWLKEYVHKSLARVSERMGVLRIREQCELDLALIRARVDVSTAGDMRARFVATGESIFKDAMRTLDLMMKERRKSESEATRGPEPPAKKRKTRNERP